MSFALKENKNNIKTYALNYNNCIYLSNCCDVIGDICLIRLNTNFTTNIDTFIIYTNVTEQL